MERPSRTLATQGKLPPQKDIPDMSKNARAWQRMLSGRRLDLLNPSPLDIEIGDIAHGLARVARWNGQTKGPEIFSVDPRAQSDSVTAVLTPEGYDANKLRSVCLDKFNVSLGGGLGPLQGRVFRIGHLGDLNEPMILGSLAAVEMALELTGVPHGKGGVNAAMDYLISET